MPDPSLLNGVNAVWLEHLYESWLRDPASVDRAWHACFEEIEHTRVRLPVPRSASSPKASPKSRTSKRRSCSSSARFATAATRRPTSTPSDSTKSSTSDLPFPTRISSSTASAMRTCTGSSTPARCTWRRRQRSGRSTPCCATPTPAVSAPSSLTSRRPSRSAGCRNAWSAPAAGRASTTTRSATSFTGSPQRASSKSTCTAST